MSNHSNIVVAEGLEKSFGDTKALVGLDLQLEEGTILGVLGPNGAGKTTAVRILTTLSQPDAGWAEVAGHNVVEQPTAVRQRIGVTGQYAAVDELLTGRENLEMVGRLSRLSRIDCKTRAVEMLERLELTDAADRVVSGYSGGMRRRLDLAASMMATPPVVFLDEPTTGLDPRSRMQMWSLIKDLVDSGISIFLTTQYLEEADQLADQIMIINHGLTIAEGTATELKASVGGQRLEIVVNQDGDLAQAARAIDALGNGTVHIDEPNRRVAVPITVSNGLLPRVVRDLDDRGVELDDIGIHRPTLDDVFLTLTGRTLEEEAKFADSMDEHEEQTAA